MFSGRQKAFRKKRKNPEGEGLSGFFLNKNQHRGGKSGIRIR